MTDNSELDRAEALGFSSIEEMDQHQAWIESQKHEFQAILDYQFSDEALQRRNEIIQNQQLPSSSLIFVLPEGALSTKAASDFVHIDTRNEYSMSNEHPDHPLDDWRYEVINEDTHLGYNDWVHHRIEADEHLVLDLKP
ncbi:hypothetical protein Q9L42_020525 (plasmid) [Methylomarinum sp. Ch1-1]|uniref:Uncharacterized protein n=1 Tax=Methylomarinum roseum TaxID=3067653 RepID=A0AAU7P0H2_9GAMM|nr:hypothetical protein [Methylomarinum sp. Ch1-1]MDP4523304.1 hypothetical protein [Methylomarinum sp. Ch1-1]